jgi:DnaJ-class molecular chaperone
MAESDSNRTKPSTTGTTKLNPGDDAPPGTPGTGENVCPQCSGSGKLQGAPCPNCGGTGTVIKGIAGG